MHERRGDENNTFLPYSTPVPSTTLPSTSSSTTSTSSAAASETGNLNNRTETFSFQAYENTNYEGNKTQVYNIVGNYTLGFAGNSYVWKQDLESACCATFCSNGQWGGWRCTTIYRPVSDVISIQWHNNTLFPSPAAGSSYSSYQKSCLRKILQQLPTERAGPAANILRKRLQTDPLTASSLGAGMSR